MKTVEVTVELEGFELKEALKESNGEPLEKYPYWVLANGSVLWIPIADLTPDCCSEINACIDTYVRENALDESEYAKVKLKPEHIGLAAA